MWVPRGGPVLVGWAALQENVRVFLLVMMMVLISCELRGVKVEQRVSIRFHDETLLILK